MQQEIDFHNLEGLGAGRFGRLLLNFRTHSCLGITEKPLPVVSAASLMEGVDYQVFARKFLQKCSTSECPYACV